MFGYVVDRDLGSFGVTATTGGNNTLNEWNSDLSTGSVIYTPGSNEHIVNVYEVFTTGDALIVLLHDDGTEDASLRRITENGDEIWDIRISSAQWPAVYKRRNEDIFWFSTDKEINEVLSDGSSSVVYNAAGDSNFLDDPVIRNLYVEKDGSKLYPIVLDSGDYHILRIDVESGSTDYAVNLSAQFNSGAGVYSSVALVEEDTLWIPGPNTADGPSIVRMDKNSGAILELVALNNTASASIEDIAVFAIITNKNLPSNEAYAVFRSVTGSFPFVQLGKFDVESKDMIWTVDIGGSGFWGYNDAAPSYPDPDRIISNTSSTSSSSSAATGYIDPELNGGMTDNIIGSEYAHFSSDGTRTPLPGPAVFIGELGPSIIPNFWTGFKSTAEIIPGNRGVEE